ncbi:hypothetical protein [Vibrio splendidus]|uniref:hypothetical protein n=1 Tax=Vibrio splendidus TaxID=29497 RepID=UPI0021591416|nr:hypothetical protein [Vibrio splendidus]
MTCLKCQEKSVTDFCVKVPKKFLWFSWYGYQRQTLCREHLLLEYRKSFTTSQARLVVFYPDFEYKRKGLYQYLPTPLREFEEFALHDNKQGERKEDLITLKETFRKLRGFCEKCGKPAQVAFFCTGSFAWEQKPFSPCTTSDQVIISSICAQPEILCMQCCYSQVEPSLSACDLKRIGGIHSLPQHGEHCLIGVEE